MITDGVQGIDREPKVDESTDVSGNQEIKKEPNAYYFMIDNGRIIVNYVYKTNERYKSYDCNY